MYEIIFLIVLALCWIIFASLQDLKNREVANWLSFSLIIFALGFRFFCSLFGRTSFDFFYQGLIGLGIFFILGDLFYYGRLFAGGDAKLMIALGTILPFSENFVINAQIFILFFLIFLFAGAIYSLVWSVALSIRNFKSLKKEFSKRFRKSKKISFFVMILGLILMSFGFFVNVLFIFGISVFILPYFYLFMKSVDESCMIKKIKVNDLVEGDWLYKDLKVGKKLIKANWEGLERQDINLIKKNYKTIAIRQGIPFVPVFLISFLVLIYLWEIGLWNSFW